MSNEELLRMYENAVNNPNLNLKTYIRCTKLTASYNDDHGSAMSYLMNGLVSEVGELSGKVAKMQLATMNNNAEKNLAAAMGYEAENGDVMWYAARIIHEICGDNDDALNRACEVIMKDLKHTSENYYSTTSIPRILAIHIGYFLSIATDEKCEPESLKSLNDDSSVFEETCGLLGHLMVAASIGTFHLSRASDDAFVCYSGIYEAMMGAAKNNLKKLKVRLDDGTIIGFGDGAKR